MWEGLYARLYSIFSDYEILMKGFFLFVNRETWFLCDLVQKWKLRVYKVFLMAIILYKKVKKFEKMVCLFAIYSKFQTLT